jgi:hypothetical protein
MERIIKEFWEDCKSSFIAGIIVWFCEQIWKLCPFREEISVMFTLALIQSIPSFLLIPAFLTICYILILILDYLYKLKKSPFKILLGQQAPLSDMRFCESCNKTMSVESPYTILIQNNGRKTIEQVSVMFNNRYAINKETNSKYCNLNSGAVGRFVFYLTEDQKEIEVTVTGKNVLPSSKTLFIEPFV